MSSEADTGCTPRLDTAPYVGRIPDTPQIDAGSRTEPPVSVPIAARQRSAATAAPEPPLEPPGIRSGAAGLTTAPKASFAEVAPNASSCMFALPRITAPAARRRSVTSASSVGVRSAKSREPTVVGTPATSMLSLSTIGMPSSGSRCPRLRRASTSRACASASSGVIVIIACMVCARFEPLQKRLGQLDGGYAAPQCGVVDERSDLVVGHAAAATASSAREDGVPGLRGARGASEVAREPRAVTQRGGDCVLDPA